MTSSHDSGRPSSEPNNNDGGRQTTHQVRQNVRDQERTHFGFREVPPDEKESLVAGVFHSVATRYDVMNDLMSMGVHRLWKRFAIELSAVRRGHQVLDIAGGTGDLAKQFARRVGDNGRVVLADINESMLRVGRDRLVNDGLAGNIEYVQANAECLPFPDNTFDCITIAFGLRNVTDKPAALASMCRVLKPGGRLLVLEFSKTRNPLLTKVYDTYSFNLLPVMGKLIANDSESYKYLAESIRKHPDQDTLERMMKDAGFVNTTYHNMTGGIVALHKGVKP
ncbi:bifunctional demethylmenaquinone methyltransferase/2-methoxy-6-polyprenyl-1,4-benzoquinol methylase UbiE [Endozoicomonas gorgoniicola]|uniref:Ubiquinone/menaquinone biosynthesis C-methyltransferase UbiE n=1 Tax=Endozoicomonas gorgoniicola TaxID=1234144 RepID=A0ABT3N503_9GAMM|nr:bifunctional demethylmenaquinone methyltransferase/2-methoxy-6-polyprenyl-1,4-benzoquinol methylase UbiE [Endozoicomonas gorgoniicola]MCW7556289.1 bifunctional demethylmenaquinone methyltransferase/2-methoxy-6-polyprenyl-1,4-benzoquinol methylase UbiE [Endozoicomonas gorgoniicola]